MRSLFFIVLLALVPVQLFAHGLLHDQISKLNHEIHHHPDKADLYLQRNRPVNPIFSAAANQLL